MQLMTVAMKRKWKSILKIKEEIKEEAKEEPKAEPKPASNNTLFATQTQTQEVSHA